MKASVLEMLNEADALLVVLRLAWESPHGLEPGDAETVVRVTLDRIRRAMQAIESDEQ